MNNGVPMARLGDLLHRSVDTIQPQPDTEYREISVRLWGKGVVERGRVSGAQLLNRRFVARAGQLIISRIDARNGAIGLVPESLDGALVTNDFPLFDINGETLLSSFFEWLSRTQDFVELCKRASEGTTNRVRLSEERFLALQIPLPPLAEQRRVVARIEELAAQIHEARTLRHQSVQESEVLLASALSKACSGKWSSDVTGDETAQQLLDRISKANWPGHVMARKRTPISLPPPPEVPKSWLVVQAGELQERGAILDIQDGNHGSDYPRKSEFGDEGVPFITAKQLENGAVRIAEAPRLPSERASRLRIGFAKANDVLLTHNASVGDVAIAPPNAGEFLLGTSVTYWRCNPEALDHRYLFYFMRSEYFQGQLQFIMKQTTRNQVSVLKQVILWICFPPLPEQRRIVAELAALQAEVDALERLQAETAAELDALLPSILDKAFKGELW